MNTPRTWFTRVLRVVRGTPAPSRPPRVSLEGVRTVPLLSLRLTSAVALAGAFMLLSPSPLAWFIVVPLLAASLAPGGSWAAVVAAAFVGLSLAAADAGLRSAVIALLLPFAVHLSLLADAASRSDLRGVGVDVRLLGRALRSTVLVAGVVVPSIALVSFVDIDLPTGLGLLAVVGVVGLGVVTVRLTSSSRAR
ncbi:hypothetical protein [Sanguibacter sp. HDW7]|uniref:hypothetical protein n=1 Tax=Sanguibacter sp. HDW7 TaxID=2714931 RepID=UPI00140D8B99|nr:hypothetical protein [Sanguibacter sp. HDW7]QIK83506.1 hypothetical protein G7063_07610 [Sanguibacter sp. HDW7]